jgi:BirA family biotin operon repressor/biotin-[acetyl-CoA-carboxylase] ligase
VVILAFDNERAIKLREKLSKLGLLRLKKLRPVCLRSVDSTQDYLIKKLQSRSEGDFVISEIQTRGRGREGRNWLSDHGGLYLSLTLVPKTPNALDKIPLVATRAIIDTLEVDFHLRNCNFKAPNDVICHDKKIAGVLVDAEMKGIGSIAYVGIGVNLNNGKNWNNSMLKIATSYFLESGQKLDQDEFVIRLFWNFDRRFDQALRDEYFTIRRAQERNTTNANTCRLTDRN